MGGRKQYTNSPLVKKKKKENYVIEKKTKQTIKCILNKQVFLRWGNFYT